MVLIIKIFFILSTVTIPFILCLQASFYGNSFISIPLKEAKGSTDISFKFRTHLANALIVLVAGITDYCIVKLDSTRIKININLGSGEYEISSINSNLNDFKWHQVYISRTEANLTLTVDNRSISKHLPGKFFELNIHYGIFVGGHGNFSDLFFGHIGNFRGCLADIVYNGIAVLDSAKYRQPVSVVQGISWNCAAEFDSNINQPISFIEDHNFMLVSLPDIKIFKIQMEIKTTKEYSVLLYNQCSLSKQDFFSLEIWKGKIKLSLKFGDNSVESLVNEFVSDGKWHKINLRHVMQSIDLTVDSVSRSSKLPKSFTFNLLHDLFYIGGIEASKRGRAMMKGLKKSDAHFNGCMQHIKVGERMISLKDAIVTEGLLPSCVWQYPCLKWPCEYDDAVCVQKGLDSYQCICKNTTCNFGNTSNHSPGSLASNLELISLETLHVLEGQSVLITTHNIHLNLDYVKYGISDSGISFRIIEFPEHGTVKNNAWPQDKNTFTYLDLSKDKVNYIHDGSESQSDKISMDIQFIVKENFILPAHLQGTFKFTLNVQVEPYNDPPELKIPISTVLRVAEGKKKIVTKNILEAFDPDTPMDNLVFKVVNSDIGHFEYTYKPDIKISSFTQKDIFDKNVVFVHNISASNYSYISLQVSDGIEESKIAKLRVSSYPQMWWLQNNTGLFLVHDTAGIITPYNLSFVSNDPEGFEKTQYLIVKAPKYGLIEVERDPNIWINTNVFSSEHLQLHRVRYRHIKESPKFDEFQFKTTLNSSAVFSFRITFIKCNLKKVILSPLVLNSTVGVVTSDQLYFQTEPVFTPATSITFVIIKYPYYGFLLSSASDYRMRLGDTFTLADIKYNNVKYSLHKKGYSIFNDSVSFEIMAPGCKNISVNLSVIYQPNEEILSQVDSTLEPITVEEGTKAVIPFKNFRLFCAMCENLIFNITESPKHGNIEVNGKDYCRNNTSFFTLTELKAEALFYIHDNSETVTDFFSFMALSTEENFQYVNKYEIIIKLKNDNSPFRVIEKPFHVVFGGSKLITGSDLLYHDEDINTKPSDIVYSVREITSGEIFNIKNSNHTKVTEFTQQNLNDKVILFQHKGAESGKVKLWITDGQFYVNGFLEVKASAPFIRVLTNKKVIVQQGLFAPITEDNLSFSTNLLATDNDVIYETTSKPNYGKVSYKNGSEIKYFSQAQINKGEIYYFHDVIKTSADLIKLRVRCNNAINVAQVSIWVLPSSYWEPLIIKSHQTLFVEESTSALVDKEVLEVFQTDVPATALTYFITVNSKYGYLTLLPNTYILEDNKEVVKNINRFTQANINEKRLRYIQSVANKTEDKIIFNVTNGIVWLNDIDLNIKIIPENIYLSSNPVVVLEGSSTVLSLSHIVVSTDYYKDKVTKYNILSLPKHGCVTLNKKCNKTKEFSHIDLSEGNVIYQHDGTESLQDEFVLMALAGSKQSTSVSVKVHILPVNDHVPKLIKNSGALIWEGSTLILNNSMLAATDEDLPPETILYKIIGCWWGNISLVSDPDHLLQNFTQDFIDRQLVAFRHKNGSETKFVFTLTDGNHTTEEYTFNIKTKPVELKLISKSGLHVFPLHKKSLKPHHLLTVVSDFNRPIYYDIVKPPSLGRLITYINASNTVKVINTFTQEDINNSRVFYEHTHPFLDLYANDSFTFNVKSHLTQPFLNQEFKIDVSVSSGGLGAYIDVPDISVEEGGMTSIKMNLSGIMSFLENHSGLRSPVIHASVSNPQFGYVFLKNNPNLTTFTREQIESGYLYYQHDHSDSLFDNVHLSLYLIPGYIMLTNISIPIKVNPVNDQPFVLMTPAPHLVVVQGENHTITKKELFTEDKDTSPEDIWYDVISGPSEGHLLRINDLIGVSHFSQEDINLEKIVYCHNGSLLADSFHLRVWDGKFRPEYTIFSIQVIPITLNVSSGLPLFLQQGLNVVNLSEKQFFIETNTDKNKIHFLLKQLPKNGALYVKDSQAEFFTYIDLKSGNVMYMQTNMTAFDDNFKVFCGILLGNTTLGNEIQVFVKVQPLMQINDFIVISGKKNRLTTRVLDATPLAKMTNSNPHYKIIKLPLYGQLRKIIRSSGENRNVLDISINNFSHEEIQSGLVYLVMKNIEVGWDGLQDTIEFILYADIFQPAKATLKIYIKSSSHSVLSTIPGPNDPEEHESPIYISSPNITRDYFLVVSMVVGVVILGIAVIIIIKCTNFEPGSSSKQEQMQPASLPRPPDRLISSTSTVKQNSSEGFVSVVPTMLPHCKVTPLTRDEIENCTHYPYGTEEQMDDWSSCGASDPSGPARSNVMLRRNQYWV